MASPVVTRGYYTFDGSSRDNNALLDGARIVVSQLRQSEGKSLDAGLARNPWSSGQISLQFRLLIGGLPVGEDENVIPRDDRSGKSPKTYWNDTGLVELWKVLDRIKERAKQLGAVVDATVEVQAIAEVSTRYHNAEKEKS